MSGKTYYIDNNGLRHLIKKKIHIDANGVPTQIKKKFFEGKNTFSSSHIVKYHVDVNDVRDVEVDDGGDAILWAPVPVRSGWIFTGWRENDEADPTVLDRKTVEVDGLHLYAVFRKVITVTLQGGTNVITNTGTRYYNNSNDESPVITLGSSAMSGWNIVGYREDMAATGTVSYTAGQAYTFDESKTLYAVFNRTLTLSYNGNGATGGSVAAQTGTQYYNNGYYANPTIYTRGNGYSRPDYQFDYWYNGSTVITAGNPITISGNYTLYAHWTQTVFRPVVNRDIYMDASVNPWAIISDVNLTAYPNKTVTVTWQYISGGTYDYANAGAQFADGGYQWILGRNSANKSGYSTIIAARTNQTSGWSRNLTDLVPGALSGSYSCSTNNFDADRPFIAFQSCWVGYGGTVSSYATAKGTFRVNVVIS